MLEFRQKQCANGNSKLDPGKGKSTHAFNQQVAAIRAPIEATQGLS